MPQETASLTVLPSSTAAQAYPAPQCCHACRAHAAVVIRTSCSTICAVMLGFTRRAAKKQPRTAPAAARNGRLGAKTRSGISTRTSCKNTRAHTPAKANCSTIPAVPKTAAVPHRLRSVAAIPRPRARLCAAKRVEATFSPDDASATNTVYTASTSWYSPIPSVPSRCERYTRYPIPSSRSTMPDAASHTAFFR